MTFDIVHLAGRLREALRLIGIGADRAGPPGDLRDARCRPAESAPVAARRKMLRQQIAPREEAATPGLQLLCLDDPFYNFLHLHCTCRALAVRPRDRVIALKQSRALRHPKSTHNNQ